MKYFYSPIWREEIPAEELPEKFPETFPQDNIYNIYTKGNPSNEGVSPSGDKPLDDNSDKKNIVTPNSLAAAKEFFHLINEDSAQKAQILTPLINWFQTHEGLTRKHACENLVYMVNELLIPYFASQARFMKSNHTGRLCWLNNLLKSAHGQHLLNDAARGGRQKREQAAQENRTNQRNNHPLSEFEWTDPESGMRFYDDVDEGTVNIPEEAQPEKNPYGMKYFYSPIWREEIPAEELPEKFPETFPQDNIYNIYTKGNPSNEGVSPSGDKPLDDNSDKKKYCYTELFGCRQRVFPSHQRGLRAESADTDSPD